MDFFTSLFEAGVQHGKASSLGPVSPTRVWDWGIGYASEIKTYNKFAQ